MAQKRVREREETKKKTNVHGPLEQHDKKQRAHNSNTTFLTRFVSIIATIIAYTRQAKCNY
jgi:hypothetical protein